MEGLEFLPLLDKIGDGGILVLVYLFWRFDRRLIQLEERQATLIESVTGQRCPLDRRKFIRPVETKESRNGSN